MQVGALFERFAVEFELDMPAEAEEKLLRVADVRDFIRKAYARQGIEISAGAVFDRLRQLAALLTHADASEIEPQTLLADLVAGRRAA
jgi:hypothetical protein